MDPDPLNATLIRREDFHDDLAVFSVKFDDHDVPAFQPGQFTTLGLPKPVDPEAEKAETTKRRRRGPAMIKRAYSIASPATQTSHLDFYIVLVEDGEFTPKLWALREGDRVFMGDKITGHFTLDGVPTGKNLIMVGTGTGLAPYRAMYHTYKHDHRWERIVVFDGCRYARDLGYLPEFQRLAEEDDRLTYLPTVTREPDDAEWPGLRGRVTDHMQPASFEQVCGFPLRPEDCSVFLCGNPQMIDQLEEELTGLGFVTKDRKHPEGNIHLERYW